MGEPQLADFHQIICCTYSRACSRARAFQHATGDDNNENKILNSRICILRGMYIYGIFLCTIGTCALWGVNVGLFCYWQNVQFVNLTLAMGYAICIYILYVYHRCKLLSLCLYVVCFLPAFLPLWPPGFRRLNRVTHPCTHGTSVWSVDITRWLRHSDTTAALLSSTTSVWYQTTTSQRFSYIFVYVYSSFCIYV